MSRGRHLTRVAARVDANQATVVKALRAAGAYVNTFGPVDLLVGYGGKWHVLEVKDGAKTHSEKRLTSHEIEWILKCRNIAPIYLVESIEQALAAVGAS